ALVPVLAVVAEIEFLGLPLLALPEVVELAVAEQLDVGGAIRRLVQRRIRRRLVVRALRSRPETGRRLLRLHPFLPRYWLPGTNLTGDWPAVQSPAAGPSAVGDSPGSWSTTVRAPAASTPSLKSFA